MGRTGVWHPCRGSFCFPTSLSFFATRPAGGLRSIPYSKRARWSQSDGWLTGYLSLVRTQILAAAVRLVYFTVCCQSLYHPLQMPLAARGAQEAEYELCHGHLCNGQRCRIAFHQVSERRGVGSSPNRPASLPFLGDYMAVTSWGSLEVLGGRGGCCSIGVSRLAGAGQATSRESG